MLTISANIAVSALWFVALAANATVTDGVFRDGKGNSVSEAAVNAMSPENALAKGYQVAMTLDSAESVTCFLVFSKVASASISRKDYKNAIVYDEYARTANYVVGVGKSRGLPSQAIDNLLQAGAKQVGYMSGAELAAKLERCFHNHDVIYPLLLRAGKVESKIGAK